MGGCTDLQKYSNYTSWCADSKYVNKIWFNLFRYIFLFLLDSLVLNLKSSTVYTWERLVRNWCQSADSCAGSHGSFVMWFYEWKKVMLNGGKRMDLSICLSPLFRKLLYFAPACCLLGFTLDGWMDALWLERYTTMCLLISHFIPLSCLPYLCAERCRMSSRKLPLNHK